MDQPQTQQNKKFPWWVLILLIVIFAVTGILIFKLRWAKSSAPSEPNTPPIEQPVETGIQFEKIYDSKFGFIQEKKAYTINNQTEFDKLWNNIRSRGDESPLPQIDWQKEVVAVVAMGPESNCRTLDINRIFQSGNKDIVEYTVTGPGEGCACTLEIRWLVEVVKFQESGNLVEFSEKEETFENCQK